MKNIKVGIVGLGYVGLPVAVAFSKKYYVTGYDINQTRVKELNKFDDITLEVSNDKLKGCLENKLKISSDISDIIDCNIYIITVPTPINLDKSPDLNPLLSATNSVGKILNKGDIVIYESTVYPGCTEEKCVPILEQSSGLKFNKDFYCGYSPERINPGDKEHSIEKITKVTSGSTREIGIFIDNLYSSILDAGTYLAESIKVAEAAKVIENAQRDINIAFVNELAKIFSLIDIDTTEVLKAASTKWNFLNFKPGLVGGHCIGVDPYYLADKSLKMGYNPRIILSGREVNDGMGRHVANEVIQLLDNKADSPSSTKVLIMGVTFKENCPDYRNTKVTDIIEAIIEIGFDVDVFDPWVNSENFEKDYNLKVLNSLPKKKYDAIVLAVAHNAFKEINLSKIKANNNSVVYDIKSFYDKKLVTKRL
jgi:UDP-N-acetyl-D-glucosamine/UDP-N-acetyl-D-galactosamine dehydrogenase